MPAIATEPTVTSTGPVFVKTNFCSPDTAPTATVPKSNGVGARDEHAAGQRGAAEPDGGRRVGHVGVDDQRAAARARRRADRLEAHLTEQNPPGATVCPVQVSVDAGRTKSSPTMPTLDTDRGRPCRCS